MEKPHEGEEILQSDSQRDDPSPTTVPTDEQSPIAGKGEYVDWEGNKKPAKKWFWLW